MNDEKKKDSLDPEEIEGWEPPKIIQQGKVEIKLFSDEPDPWGDP